jgi:hypothetical protein
LAASPAIAGGAPALEVKWTLDGNLILTDLPAGDPAGSGFRYNGGGSFGSVFMTYSLFGDPDPIVSGSFTLENMSNATVEVELQVTLPILPSLPDFTVMTGSVAVSMTADLDGGELAALPGIPFWQGMIDGSTVGGATDLLSGLSMFNPGPGSPPGESAGFVGIDGPAALDSIGIRISFSLTPGEQMSFTSVFNVVVPGPSGLALLAALGAVRTRRRRRAR